MSHGMVTANNMDEWSLWEEEVGDILDGIVEAR